MNFSRNQKLIFALSLLLIASLACQTLLEPEEIFTEDNAADTNSDSSPSTPADNQNNSGDTGNTPPTPSDRLSGQDLPVLTFGPPGDSLSDPNRPALSGGDVQTLGTSHFLIHYTLTGDDAVPSADSDGNGHPDFVEEVAVAVEYAWIAQIDHFGWAAPPADEGIGGDDRYDVYLENIFEDGTAGYTEGGFSDTLVGDNPNSSVVESDSSHSYIALDNDYAEFEDYAANGVSAIQFMRSTSAHEFLHAVQYGYDGSEPLDWLWEASANWIQDEILNDYNDSIEDLSAVFKAPDSCQLVAGGEDRVEDENHWYGLWAFFRFYSERYGHSAVIEVWENAATLDGYDIWDNVLSQRGTSLEEFFRNYSVALLTRDFEEGANYPRVRLEGEASQGSTFFPNDGVGQLGADYVRINASGISTINLQAEDLEGLLVAISADGQSHLFPFNGVQVSLDADDYDYIYAIILNQLVPNGIGACRFTDYSLDVQSGGSPSSPSLSTSAPNFEAPLVEGLLDPEEYFGEAGGGSAEAPPELALIYIPDGYDFYESYDLTREEFGNPDLIDFYIPANVVATNLDYYGSNGTDYLFVLASDSPYQSLDAFISSSGLDGDSYAFSGVPVMIEDISDSDGPYTSATLVMDGLFVVIEGSISPAEMQNVVAAWIDR